LSCPLRPCVVAVVAAEVRRFLAALEMVLGVVLGVVGCLRGRGHLEALVAALALAALVLLGVRPDQRFVLFVLLQSASGLVAPAVADSHAYP